jgi:hypothetical protein
MQNAEEADPGSEVLGVGRNFEHGLSAGAEEQVIKQPLVLEVRIVDSSCGSVKTTWK